MAILTLDRKKLIHNYKVLDQLFEKNKINWTIVTKLLCGNKPYIKEVLSLGIKQVSDSRISNLKTIKELSPRIETIYIKPPALPYVKSVVKYADISLNSQFRTIKALSREALKQKKIHKVIIMIEMGDLREGVLGTKLIQFYSKVFKLKGIKIIGLGTNLNCLHGVMPSRDKLIQLSLYKQLIELKFNERIPYISGGTTVTIPLINEKLLTQEVNHFRVGEALYFGADLFTGKTLKGMYSNVFELKANIIEIEKKPMVPNGITMENPQGEVFKANKEDVGKHTHRAIIDLGQLDINPKYLKAKDKNIEIIGSSSDMIVLDLKQNTKEYQTGSQISFTMSYMGVLGLMNSSYIDKEII